MIVVTGLYAGRAGVLEPAGRRSAILKAPVTRVRVTRLGLVGDEQADRRYHGGPEQAVHQFAIARYAQIVARLPALSHVAVPGSLGENLSCPILDEDTVCIGDVYAVGDVELEVSQPRRPCTTIDARYGVTGLATWLASQHLTGWYYRVQREGEIALGDPVVRIARPNPDVSLTLLMEVAAAARPDCATLERIIDCTGLGPDWRRRLRERLAWLRR